MLSRAAWGETGSDWVKKCFPDCATIPANRSALCQAFRPLVKSQHILLFRDFPFQVCPENGIFVTSTRRKLIKPIEKNLRKLFVKLQKRQPAKVRQQILEAIKKKISKAGLLISTLIVMPRSTDIMSTEVCINGTLK